MEQAGGLGVKQARRTDRALERRVRTLESKVTTIESTLETVKTSSAKAATDTDEILAVLRGAKSMGGFIRKQAPRLVTFGVGIAIALGWVSAETGRSISVLLGV